ncbi:hypothetical protein [Lacticaseibacillus jixiensis]|uniref:hypothetical protein n=1 Tax=Lacticaseibacillus jixiensis TaxID=3231926 RepID=UPI0036F2D042
MTTTKTFKIIAISDDHTVIINAGKREGITTKDAFDILDSEIKQLIDPDTKELLDEFQQKKQRVYVHSVRDKYCICVSKYKQSALESQMITSVTSSLTEALLNPASRYAKRETVGENLNIDKDEISGILNEYNHSLVHVGDVVQLVNK